jgi:hypothetical protein
MKYTAIEWLVEQLEGDDAMIARVIGLKKYNSIIKQAKEMEKQQIIDFANNYGFDVCGYDYDNAEQYYNKTFKTK